MQNATNKPMFEAIVADPERAIRVSDSMNWLAKHEGFSTDHLLKSYYFTDYPGACFVDVGGGQGHVDVVIAKQVPSMRLIVQNQLDVVNKGREGCPTELRSRVSFTEHDFFSQQPAEGADFYFLRMILHDWSDKYAKKIISALLPALKAGKSSQDGCRG